MSRTPKTDALERRPGRESKEQAKSPISEPSSIGEIAAPTDAVPTPAALPTFDDIVTLLMQLDSADMRGFERLRKMLATLIPGKSISDSARESLVRAKKRLEEFLGGDGSSVEDALCSISILLEEAVASSETPSSGKPHPAQVVPRKPDAMPGAVIEPAVTGSRWPACRH